MFFFRLFGWHLIFLGLNLLARKSWSTEQLTIQQRHIETLHRLVRANLNTKSIQLKLSSTHYMNRMALDKWQREKEKATTRRQRE